MVTASSRWRRISGRRGNGGRGRRAAPIDLPGRRIAYVLQRRTGGQYVEAARRQLPGGVQVVDRRARDGAISFTARDTASSFGT